MMVYLKARQIGKLDSPNNAPNCVKSETDLKREIRLTVFCTPQPQGSMKAFVVKGRACLTSDNTKLKSYRQEVTREAILRVAEFADRPLFGKHVPVEMEVKFFFRKPPSVAKKRTCHVVKPDLSKLLRATEDALTGVVYHDDAQIVSEVISKEYGDVERTEIVVREARG